MASSDNGAIRFLTMAGGTRSGHLTKIEAY